jgi:hypothetical protein
MDDYDTMAHEMLVAEADARLQIAEAALAFDPSPDTIADWLEALENREDADDPRVILEAAIAFKHMDEDERDLTLQFFGNK